MIHPKYRPDIDGLRAIAVLSVVGFHASPERLSGGFIGVDIFFVISGYLISTIIIESLAKGAFSFAEFYIRRINRIFPALIIVLLSCYFFGWHALLATEYKQLGLHMAGGAGFVPNFVYLSEAGYFDGRAETKPLLHLWSLGIEEQFYLVFPLIMVLAWKRINALVVVAVFIVLSFFLNLYFVVDNRIEAFYMPYTRFWELLCGSALACMANNKGRSIVASRGEKKHLELYKKNGFSILGLLLLMYALVSFNKEISFPGYFALIPVFGAVLIIAAGPAAFLNRYILSSKLFVWFGLISYPLYLWHWTIFSFVRIIEGGAPVPSLKVVAILVSVILAWLTYEFIEKKIRGGKYGLATPCVLLSLLLFIGVSGLLTYKNYGYPQREGASINGYYGNTGTEEWFEYIEKHFFPCVSDSVIKEEVRWKSSERCSQSKSGMNIDLALLGDSHAEHHFIGAAHSLSKLNVATYITGYLPNVDDPKASGVISNILNNKNIRHVVVSVYWIDKYKYIKTSKDLGEILANLVLLLEASGKKVYLMQDVPSFGFYPEDNCTINRRFSGNKNRCEIPEKLYLDSNLIVKEAFGYVEKRSSKVKILNVRDYFCRNDLCSMMQNGKVIFRDDNHLNIYGSKYLWESIVNDNPDIFHVGG